MTFKDKLWGWLRNWIIFFHRMPRVLLQKMYQFDSWHLQPVALGSKQYVKVIIKYCNENFKNKSFVEIGCGLGDIIRKISSKNRTGLDIDQKVINAARFLNKSIVFKRFSFLEDELVGKYDVIIMVNWIHMIDPETLKNTLEKYFEHNLNTYDGEGVIIIDIVPSSGYKYNHDIVYLTGNNRKYTKIYEEEKASRRKIYVIKK